MGRIKYSSKFGLQIDPEFYKELDEEYGEKLVTEAETDLVKQLQDGKEVMNLDNYFRGMLEKKLNKLKGKQNGNL